MGVSAGPVGAQCGQQEEQLLDEPGQGDFGDAVAIEGDVAVVAAPLSGRVHVYRDVDGTWVPEQELTPIGGGAGPFGTSVAVSGDTILVGAPFDGAGSLHVFRESGGVWTGEQELVASGGPLQLGASVALDGDLAVGGAPSGQGAGAACVFRHDGTAWIEEQTLVPSDGAGGDRFGEAVAVSGDAILVGAPLQDDPAGAAADRGAVYAFRKAGARWTEEQKLVLADGEPSDLFGTSVSLSGDALAVGALVGPTFAGAAYVYRHDGTAWGLEEKLLPTATPLFGSAVSLDGDALLVGAPCSFPSKAGGCSGSGTLFRHDGAGWIVVSTLTASGPDDLLGESAALGGARVLLGTPEEDLAYAFDVPELLLRANAPALGPSEVLALTTCGGGGGQPVLLALVGVSGAPLFLPLAASAFDAAGVYAVSAPAAPGLSGLSLSFRTFGFLDPTTVGQSETVEVAFL